MHRSAPVALALLLAACKPNNATLTSGHYMAFIADGSSLSLAKELVPLDKYPTYYQVDCREFETPEDEAALRLPEWISVCGDNQWPPVYEQWAIQDGFHVVSEELKPWRGEAIITAEGDLQLAFHHRIPGGQDMRFVFSVDPDFRPQECVLDENGKSKRVDKDGEWIKGWSEETLGWIQGQFDSDKATAYPGAFAHMEPYLDGGKLYFMNARSYQYNPVDTNGPDWDLPAEWIAGAAQGKFVEEEIFHRTARYGDPQVYNAVELSGSTETQYQNIRPDDLFYCLNIGACEDITTTDEPNDCALQEDHDGMPWWVSTCQTEMDDRVHDIASDIHKELQRLMQPDKEADPVFDYAPLVHMNYWRKPDARAPGLDGWGELQYNYVVFSGDSVLEAGGAAKGAFSLVLDADQSSTRVFIEGQFEIDKIKKDHWTTANLAHDKLEEAGETLCSAASPEDADPAGYAN